MNNVGEVVMTFIMLWLVIALVRGLAFDFWHIGEEPGGHLPEKRDSNRTFQQRRQSRIYMAYPFMALLAASLLVLMFI